MQYDIAVIGAGPAGLAFTRSLAGTGLRIAQIDRQTKEQLAEPAVDGRDIALTHLSRRLLQQLGAWERIPDAHISPLQQAKVVDGDSPYVLGFDGSGQKDEPLGYLIANHWLRRSLYEAVAPMDAIDWHLGCAVKQVSSDADGATVALQNGEKLQARLLIGADTRFSESRRQMGIAADMNDFGRVAIVCRMEHELSHENVAWECFHYGRTLAILPMPGHASSIVITVPASQAAAINAMDEATFNRDIEQRFEHRLGRMRLVGERFTYPLVGVHAKRFVASRFALIGDAAVGMHPVTAHGFNLGLSGQDILTGLIKTAHQRGEDIANAALLQRYQKQHRLASMPLFYGTNSVVGLFTDDRPPAKLLRKAVMHLSNHLPPVKWAIKQKLISRDHVRLPGLM